MTAPLLEIGDLAVNFGRGARTVEAVRGISLTVGRGETVAPGRRKRFGQVGDGAVGPANCCPIPMPGIPRAPSAWTASSSWAHPRP